MDCTSIRLEHEQGVVKAFFVREKHARYLEFLSNPKRRKKFTNELRHFKWFDRRFTTLVSWKSDPTLNLSEGYQRGLQNISSLLRGKGAGSKCWVISEDSSLDQQNLDLEFALRDALDTGMAAIFSCVAGKLAFFVGEDEMLLLSR